MTGIILFQSKYGATRKYADWLAQATGYAQMETKRAAIPTLMPYDVIILAGGIYASGIAGLSFLRKNLEKLRDKRIAVFCVGASPYDETAFRQIYAHNFAGVLQGTPCFYGRGAWNEENMSLTDRTLCKMLRKAVAKQDPSTYEPWQKALIEATGHSCDWTNQQYLAPLLAWIAD